VLVNTTDIAVAQLADLGVRRISVGAALARVAWGAFIRAAKEIKENGTFDSLGDAAPFNQINDLFLNRG
jgi:2-methylisocitrate lyase-like PEP mutase family enzyme